MEEGNTLYLVCVGYGNPAASVSWERDGVTVANDSRATIYDMLLMEGGSDFTQSVLEICSAELTDAGTYTCAVDNGVGTDSSSFDVNVIESGGKLWLCLNFQRLSLPVFQLLLRSWYDLLKCLSSLLATLLWLCVWRMETLPRLASLGWQWLT